MEEFEISDTIWHLPEADAPFEATIKIRYGHPGAAATIEPLDRRAREGSSSGPAARGDSRPGGRLLSRRSSARRRLDLP